MPDVFLSYKKEDRKHVQRVAAAVEAAGLTTWWDDRINPTERWERDIFKALDGSRAVLVLWTPLSVNSSFVLEEARRGAKRKRLLQALIEPCDIPDEFIGRVMGQQYYSIIGWKPGFEHEGWNKLLEKLQTQCTKRRWSLNWRSRTREDLNHWPNGILKASTLEAGAHSGTVFCHLKNSPEMVLIPTGEFVMGSPEEGRYGDDREDPQRQVRIQHHFAVSRYPVTVEQFSAFVAATGHQTRGIPNYWDGQKWNEAGRIWGEDLKRRNLAKKSGYPIRITPCYSRELA